MGIRNVYRIVLKSTSGTYSKYVVAYSTDGAISKIRDYNDFNEVVETKLEVSDVLV